MNLIVRIQLSVMMFIQLFIWGCWFVTMWPYLAEIGFDDSQKGNAYSTTGWAAMISPFFVGMIADRFFSTEKVLGVLHLVGGVLLFYLTTITDPQLFFWVLLSYTLCYMPTLALVNSISFDQMTDPSKEFPGIRVLGTIGWIAAGLLIGLVIPRITGQSIEDTTTPFIIAGWVSLAMGVYCFFLPHTPP
ncbi:MAG: MFS transporter, partial [Planctomycetes bacterium]|nr:MFS transporter [Planctomycetota bacterium]